MEGEPTWLQPTVIAAGVALVGTLVGLLASAWHASRARKREHFANAFAAVADYWEFPYVVRRRRHDEPAAERVRISEALRAVQRDISFHQAWVTAESPEVARHYAALVQTTREVMGTQIHDGWLAPPPRTDEHMNIPGIRRDGLAEATDAYLAAVRDHLSVWPDGLRRAARRLRRKWQGR